MSPQAEASFIGLDLGTSGCRAIAIDAGGQEIARARVGLPAPERPAPGHIEQDPELWWAAAQQVLGALAQDLRHHAPNAICVDATSASVLLTDPSGQALGRALMYSDQSATDAARRVAEVAPLDSPARGPSAGLAKLIALADRLKPGAPALALHQADWISGRLCGRFGWSDWNNALKTGFDPIQLGWPDWVLGLLPREIQLPRVQAPGTAVGFLDPAVAARLGLPNRILVLAGTTDSTAAAIAAGAARPGDAVTSLGSTLVIKVVADRPITASRYGVYSHRFADGWILGGASNSGGAVLRQYFTEAEIRALSRLMDPSTETGLDYYPLPAAGERFPRHDPSLQPLLEPRPQSPEEFLQGLFEGIAAIEAEGYAKLAELGAPMPTRIATLGGGSANAAWTRIRSQRLGVPVITAPDQEAAYGAAKLALKATTDLA
ncbi:FGGY-family carbohydrate kinase [Thiorhodococcus mannitoliphagus]|uniref:FGGY-family carbohydrate kinase n=1 Tax=Thiorhodococcus mannitoliphagus TaxID=329406 RepID=A0A6P1DNB9_9GAMM|nr:FGGY-family carbohydrate kinase [Thiorhodococcus mannitoliphagus]NEX19429.1 FGGY-family carbohydrate kinase [Thiorhodococcus mannitoliphagus]